MLITLSGTDTDFDPVDSAQGNAAGKFGATGTYAPGAPRVLYRVRRNRLRLNRA